jgi:hypothetical protein
MGKSQAALKVPNAKIKQVDTYQNQRSSNKPLLLAPQDQILHLQRTIGNQAVQKLFKSGVIDNSENNSYNVKITNPSTGFIQRRIPQESELTTLVEDRTTSTTTGGSATTVPPNVSAHMKGLQFLVDKQLEDIRAQDAADGGNRMQRINARLPANYNTLPADEKLLEMSKAITTEFPKLQLKDPALINIPPTNPTEVSNLQTLVDKTNQVFDQIIAGARDSDLTDVFGASNLATAKSKYQNAKTWMNNLHAGNKIITDRSGYATEVGLGGLTGFQRRIFLNSNVIDNPNDNKSIIIMLHESMHAGNSDVHDYGYLGSPNFKALPENTKLTNAAHYEVASRRLLIGSNPLWDGVFTPAGQTTPSGTVVTLSDTEKAMKESSEFFRKAWTMGLWLHNLYLDVYKNPSLWEQQVPSRSVKYQECLPYWSKVENLTIHEKTDIQTTGTTIDEAKMPVSQLDMALSERVTKKLSIAGQKVSKQEQNAKQLLQHKIFLWPIINIIEKIIQFFGGSVTSIETSYLISIIIKDLNGITGDYDRDMKAVGIMSNTAYNDIFIKRNPSLFS